MIQQGCLAPGANQIGSGANQAPIEALAPIGANRRQSSGANQFWRQSAPIAGANQRLAPINYFHSDLQWLSHWLLGSQAYSRWAELAPIRRQSIDWRQASRLLAGMHSV